MATWQRVWFWSFGVSPANWFGEIARLCRVRPTQILQIERDFLNASSTNRQASRNGRQAKLQRPAHHDGSTAGRADGRAPAAAGDEVAGAGRYRVADEEHHAGTESAGAAGSRRHRFW